MMHPSLTRVARMCKLGNIVFRNHVANKFCDCCAAAAQKRGTVPSGRPAKRPKLANPDLRPWQKVHMDVAGPHVKSKHDAHRHMVIIVDTCTRRKHPLFLREMCECCDAVEDWFLCTEDKRYKCEEVMHTGVVNTPNGMAVAAKHPVTSMRVVTDAAPHFASQQMRRMGQKCNAVIRPVPPTLVAFNGLAERAIGVIANASLASRTAAKLDSSYWAWGNRQACYTSQFLPTKGVQNNCSPFWAEKGRHPTGTDLKQCKPFGCIGHSRQRVTKKDQPKGTRSAYVGFNERLSQHMACRERTKKKNARLVMTTGMSFDIDLPTSVGRPLPKTIPHMNLPAHPTEDEATVPNMSLSTEELQQVISQNPQSANAQKACDQLTAQAVDTYEGQHAEQTEVPSDFQHGPEAPAQIFHPSAALPATTGQGTGQVQGSGQNSLQEEGGNTEPQAMQTEATRIMPINNGQIGYVTVEQTPMHMANLAQARQNAMNASHLQRVQQKHPVNQGLHSFDQTEPTHKVSSAIGRMLGAWPAAKKTPYREQFDTERRNPQNPPQAWNPNAH